MDPILERKDIICSFENSNGERVSITDSLVIHSLKNDEEESSLCLLYTSPSPRDS